MHDTRESAVPHAVPVRTVGEQAYRIRELRVRFYRADMMFKPSPEAADEYLKGVVNAAGKESSSAVVPDVLTALRNGETLLVCGNLQTHCHQSLPCARSWEPFSFPNNRLH